VLRWADQMTIDFRDILGYTLVATTRQVRLIRRLDALDGTQTAIFAAKSGRPFDRRRLAYLCLVLASFQRSRVEISLADLVRTFTPPANAIEGLGFDPATTSHRAAVVDVLDWLVDRGVLRLSDGSVESWANDTERGDALYDIDHDIGAALFRPARPVQHLTSAVGLRDATFTSAKRQARREAAAQRAARALIEYPVVYYAQAEREIAEALGQSGVAENLARLTGLPVERRAEGIMLADAGGRFTDRPFPGRGGDRWIAADFSPPDITECPLFAAANALYSSAMNDWVTTATVPMIAHYDMYHDKTTRTTSSLLMLWDGGQLIDAAAGYQDNDALVTELLGFRPTRYAPLGTDSTLRFTPAPEPDEDDDEDDDADLVPDRR
jgi:uncharacterized protein (TIGR02678 family)